MSERLPVPDEARRALESVVGPTELLHDPELIERIAAPVVAAELRRLADAGTSLKPGHALFHEDDLRARADELHPQS